MANGSLSQTVKVVLIGAVLAIAAGLWMITSRPYQSGVASYYPLQVGNTWSYTTTQRGKKIGGPETPESIRFGTVEQQVTGFSPRSSEELEIFEVTQKVEFPGVNGEPAQVGKSVLRLSSTPAAITLHGILSDEGPSASFAEPVTFLSDPPSAEPVTSGDGSVRTSLTIKSQVVEPIEVPAGNFEKALKRFSEGEVAGSMAGMPISSGTMQETTWFVRGVGVVRQDRALGYTLQSPQGVELRVEESSERVLTGYSVGESN